MNEEKFPTFDRVALLRPIHIYIATTQGPSEIQRVTEEDPTVQSVVCLNGTAEALSISAAYDSFVRKPTGVIEKEFGCPTFRLDVSHNISSGRSWQLGFFAAHALYSANFLGEHHDEMKHAIWITGEVDNQLNVRRVDHVVEKLKASEQFFEKMKVALIPVTVIIPRVNFEELSEPTLKGVLDGNRIIAVDKASDIFHHLDIDRGASFQVPTIVDPTTPISNWPKIATAAVFGLLLIVSLVLWRAFPEWIKMAEKGHYDMLGASLIENERGSCYSCKVFAKAFRAYLAYSRLPEKDLDLSVVEKRTHENKRCSFIPKKENNFIRKTLVLSALETFGPSTGSGLCAVEYTLRYFGKSRSTVWIMASSNQSSRYSNRNKSVKFVESSMLSFGENISIKMTLPNNLKNDLIYWVIAVAGPYQSPDVKSWLLEEAVPPNFEKLRERFKPLGLTILVAKHVIEPPIVGNVIRYN